MKIDWREKPKCEMSITDLTRREREIGELLAWGATKKEIALHLDVSLNTIDNHARNIFEKTGCTKVNEFSAWWFCRRFNISVSLSPMKRIFASLFFLILLAPSAFDFEFEGIRAPSARVARAGRGNRRDGFDVDDGGGEIFFNKKRNIEK